MDDSFALICSEELWGLQTGAIGIQKT